MATEGKQYADELLSTLTDEQREQVRSLKTPEEMLSFAKNEGVELTDDQLNGIVGGKWLPSGGGYSREE